MTELSTRDSRDDDRAQVLLPKRVEHVVTVSAFVILALLLFAAVPWRTNQYFSGQFDLVVLAKTGLMLLALVVAFWINGYAKHHRRPAQNVPAFAFFAIFVYFCSSTLGALLFGSFTASMKLSMRAIVFALTILLLFEAVRAIILIEMFARLLTLVVLCVAVTGKFSQTGRLTADFPPLHPNEMAFLAAVPMVYFIWRTANVDSSVLRTACIAALGVVVVLTDSRTTTATVLVVIVLLILRGKRNAVTNLAVFASLILAFLFLLMFTETIQSFSGRSGTSPIETFGSRTIAWDAVLNSARSVSQAMVGEGLATKKVPVAGQMWSTQLLDSSWISTFVQAGLIGLVIAALLVIYTITMAAHAGRPNCDLWIALLALVTVRSIFESGLLDTSASFIVLMLVALGAASDARTRHAVTTV